MKDQPFLLILLVGAALIIVGLGLGLGLGHKQEKNKNHPMIIYTKPKITKPRPVNL